jgi:polyisoprenoid-binding protein YceI
MKKFLFTAAMAVITFASSAQMADGKFNVDFKTSTVNWKGQKVTGSGHNGTVRVSSGQLEFKGNNLIAGKVKLNMNEISCTDLSDAESNANLLNHLRSADFFNTAQFPDANFEVTSVKAQKDGNGNTHFITGKLTIKGITKDVSFPATVGGKDGQATIKGELVIDRSQFDVRYGSETFFGELGDKAIDNNMTIVFNLVANKKA